MQMEIILLSETEQSQKVQIQKRHTFLPSVTHMLYLDRKTCMYILHEKNYIEEHIRLARIGTGERG